MSEANDTESRLNSIEQSLSRVNTYFKILGAVLVIATLPAMMVAFDMRSVISVLTVTVDSMNTSIEKLSGKMDAITANGSPRMADRIEVNSERIRNNTDMIKDIDLRVRVIERSSSVKDVSTNTNIVNLDSSQHASKPELTTRELAELEGVNQDTIRRRIHEGYYQADKIGNEYRIVNPYMAIPTVRAMHETGTKPARNGHE